MDKQVSDTRLGSQEQPCLQLIASHIAPSLTRSWRPNSRPGREGRALKALRLFAGATRAVQGIHEAREGQEGRPPPHPPHWGLKKLKAQLPGSQGEASRQVRKPPRPPTTEAGAGTQAQGLRGRGPPARAEVASARFAQAASWRSNLQVSIKLSLASFCSFRKEHLGLII